MSQVEMAFMQDADQASRRAELEAFFGPKAEYYLKAYGHMWASVTKQPGASGRFQIFKAVVWPAFFVGPVWFFYRKMWGWASGLTVMVLVIGSIPMLARAGFPVGIAMAGLGPTIYVNHAIRKLAAMRGVDGRVELERARAAGGVSKTAGWIAGTIYALLTALAVLNLVLLIRNGEPPN